MLNLHQVILFSIGEVTIVPSQDSMTFLNGQLMSEPQLVKTGSRIILGNNHVFRYTHPEQGQYVYCFIAMYFLLNIARALRATGSSVTSLIGELVLLYVQITVSGTYSHCTDVTGSVQGGPASYLPLSPSPPPASGLEDWSFAQKELLQKAGYDIRKEFEEKEREFEKKEKQFTTRFPPLNILLILLYFLLLYRITELEEQRAEVEEMFVKQKKVVYLHCSSLSIQLFLGLFRSLRPS